jgi:rod shape-determining protein MreD
MTHTAQQQGNGVIIVSFLVAYILTIVPLPDWLREARPDWAALILIYWCMALPQRVGVGVGWLVGLGQDALQSTLLGQHALGYTIIAYLTIKLHQRIRIFPLWQQALSVLVLLLLTRIILFWINGLVGRPATTPTIWLAAITGTLLWPWVFLIMREFRRSHHIR